MKNRILILLLAAAAVCPLQARITSFGEPAIYGVSEDPENWYEINPHTWDVFTTFDDEVIFNEKPNDRRTTLSAECYSSGVIDGRKVSDFTAIGSFTDRGSFFGGDGYLDLYYFSPADWDRYAQQFVFFGGWKYNLSKYVDIDIGGNFIYSTKKTAYAGLVIPGYGGATTRGDIYIGFSSDKLYINPFVFAGYDPTFDAVKFQAGFDPKFDLEPLTTISGLAIETQCVFGYVSAHDFVGQELPSGGKWKNSYAYIQAEANISYTYKHVRIFAGVGWAIHNDGKYAPNGSYLGSDNNVWTGGGIGWIF